MSAMDDLGEYNITPAERPAQSWTLPRWARWMAWLGLVEEDDPEWARDEFIFLCAVFSFAYAVIGVVLLLSHIYGWKNH